MAVPTNQELFEVSRRLAEIVEFIVENLGLHTTDPELQDWMGDLWQQLEAISEEIPSLAEQHRRAIGA